MNGDDWSCGAFAIDKFIYYFLPKIETNQVFHKNARNSTKYGISFLDFFPDLLGSVLGLTQRWHFSALYTVE